MAAQTAHMQLHYQPVFAAHARQLRDLPTEPFLEKRLHLTTGDDCRVCQKHCQVGGRGSHLLEPGSPVLDGADESGKIMNGNPARAPELFDLFRPGRPFDVDNGVSAESGQDVPLPFGSGDLLVLFQAIAGSIGGAQDGNIEAPVQIPRGELRCAQAGLDGRVNDLSICTDQGYIDAKDLAHR